MMKIDFMEELFEGVEVEWKTLGEVCGFQNGFAFKSSLFKDTGSPIIRITNIDGKNIDLTNTKYFDASDYKENTKNYEVSKGDILIAMSGATTGKIGYYQYKNTAFLNQRVGKFIPNIKIISNRYLYHFLLSKVEQIYILAGGGAQPNLSSNNLMKKIYVPIPCPKNSEKSLEIQAEIVHILDTFTELTTELTTKLTTELAARKKQYSYYRDQLLTFEEGEVEWKKLGEVARIQRGASPRPIAKFITTDEENGIPWIKIGDTMPNSKYVSQTKQKITLEGARKSRLLEKGDFIMSNSMSFGRPYILDVDGAIHDGWASISEYGTKLNSDFLYHYLSSDLVQNYWISKINSGSVSNLNAEIIKSLEIPLPPLSEQERIARILDKLDTLTTSITEGLPREIELRQKQYEYYRNMLLSFSKEEVAE